MPLTHIYFLYARELPFICLCFKRENKSQIFNNILSNFMRFDNIFGTKIGAVFTYGHLF